MGSQPFGSPARLLACCSLLAIALFGAAAAARSAPKPSWVERRPERPEHYVGIGYAASTGKLEEDRKRADAAAIDALAREVKVKVQSAFLDIAKESTKGGATQSAQQVESFVRTTVDQVLPGVELVERWQDPANGELWSYAVLLRSRVNVEPMGLQAEVLGRRIVDGETLDVVVGTGTALKSGDSLKVAFETTHDGYVYVLLYDSKGQAARVFPNPEIALDNRVKARVQYQIPTGEDWFVLDDNTGEETIYVVASREPMADIDALVAEMERAADPGASQKLATQMQAVTRGIAGIGRPGKTSFNLGNAKVQRVTQAVTGVGRAVRVIGFSHK